MNHYGDITKINGFDVPLVDIVTGGSPCQDLSVAGKRAGLDGERSGLFMEQIRIIKEMREHDRTNKGADVDIRFLKPRYMVWENVPGAFSSNKGEDFRCVLEETARIVCEDAVIPGPPKGKWQPSGCIMGDGWSIAWRVHDAQFWGVPQRRKRIALVADFGGTTAPEILFERKSLSGDFEESREEGQGIAEDAERSIGETISFQERAEKPGGGKGILIQNERIGALSTLNNQSVCYGISAYESNAMKSPNPNSGIYEADTSRTLDLNGGSPACNQGGMAVVQVETEVSVRKYPVNKEKLIDCLQNHKSITASEIAEKLNKPKTLVEHWFRKDKCFAIPDPDIWMELKALLGIETDEFDESIMTFETKPNKYDMANRIHMGDISPVLMAGSKNTLYCLEGNGQRESHKGNGYKESETMYTLNTIEQHAICIENHPNDSRVKISKDGNVQTLSSRMGTGGGNVPLVMEEQPLMLESTQNHATVQNSGISTTLTANMGMGGGYVPMVVEPEPVCVGNGQLAQARISDKVGALNCMHDQQAVMTYDTPHYVVRRLTPLECERLQGFPDGWTDIGEWIDSKGKKHKEADTPRYKALGNSIALPFWQWLAERIVAQYEGETTMASLFDGIGGFPLVFSRCGCIPKWASEIEEFPMAVTKIRFPENETE